MGPCSPQQVLRIGCCNRPAASGPQPLPPDRAEQDPPDSDCTLGGAWWGLEAPAVWESQACSYSWGRRNPTRSLPGHAQSGCARCLSRPRAKAHVDAGECVNLEARPQQHPRRLATFGLCGCCPCRARPCHHYVSVSYAQAAETTRPGRASARQPPGARWEGGRGTMNLMIFLTWLKSFSFWFCVSSFLKTYILYIVKVYWCRYRRPCCHSSSLFPGHCVIEGLSMIQFLQAESMTGKFIEFL